MSTARTVKATTPKVAIPVLVGVKHGTMAGWTTTIATLERGSKMARRKSEMDIGCRAVEECDRLFQTKHEAIQKLGCARDTFFGWNRGFAPSAMFLSRLYFMGADVIYILTGHREGDPT